MFKLQQMQKVDKSLMNRLIDHFEEMDFDDTRMLVIGLHIPNAHQAEDMKHEIQGTNKTLMDAWKIKKQGIMEDLGFDENNRLRSNTVFYAERGLSHTPPRTPGGSGGGGGGGSITPPRSFNHHNRHASGSRSPPRVTPPLTPTSGGGGGGNSSTSHEFEMS
jgi:hypothetical protein